jgi:hypothetical protein
MIGTTKISAKREIDAPSRGLYNEFEELSKEV